MLIACWSPKGGSGTTVVSCALAAVLARAGGSGGAVLADLCGDVPAALGLTAGSGSVPALVDWLGAGPGVPADALRRMELDAGGGLAVLPWAQPRGRPGEPSPGTGSPAVLAERAEDLAAALSGDDRPVVVDCGRAHSGLELAVAAAAEQSLLVLRPCYLALRRALEAPIRPSGLVVVREPNRALSSRDIEDVLGVPIRAEIPYDAAVARCVDAGLLARRIPRGLERALRQAA